MNTNEEESVSNYSLPVRKSLMEQSVLFGIGQSAFFVIFMITVILVASFGLYFSIFGVVAFLVCRLLCRKDSMTIEFLFQNLAESDFYRG